MVLTGTVADPTAKHHAGYEALLVHGVRNVSNRLAVVFQDVTVVPEEVRIKQTVENVLSWHPDLSTKDIRVDLSAGIVTLSGTVVSSGKSRGARGPGRWCLGSPQSASGSRADRSRRLPKRSLGPTGGSDGVYASAPQRGQRGPVQTPHLSGHTSYPATSIRVLRGSPENGPRVVSL